MKRRYRYLLNIFSISLLLFALYLNFVKKEADDYSAPAINSNTVTTANLNSKESKTLSAKQSEDINVLK